ncbi:MAG TPA: CDP-diacylglycerol--glycerol-3-phosphate 3-phosphatidyltransferase [Mariprofundaceae bacterium]|nr:CDP-diacylglycerol--glycerol-3-phosphate 3-phosphatidyltransferase [Mariprofundaceae bacterium]
MQWTLSNRLTMARVIVIPLFIAVCYLPGNGGNILSSLLFVVAAFTDWLDGYLARKRNEVTPFGRFLDPVADKLLVAAALVWLVEAARVPAILALVIIGREIAIGALREWLAQHASVVHVSIVAKWKTAVQMMAITLLLLHIPIAGLSMQEVGLILLWIAVLLTLWSGYEYLRDAWPELVRRREPAAEDSPQP